MADIAEQHEQASPGGDLDESHQVGNGNEARGVKRQRPSAADDDDDDDEKGGRERRKIEIKFINDKSRRHITFSKRKAGIMKKVSSLQLARLVPPFPCHPRAPHVALSRFLAHLFCDRSADNGTRRQAYELSVLTGTQVLLLVVSETGLVYTFTTPKLQPLVTKAEGKNLIQVGDHSVPINQSHASDEALSTPVANKLRQACLNAPEPSQGNENGVDDSNQVDSPEEVPQQHLPPQGARQQGMPQNPHMPPNYMPNMGMDPSNLAYGGYVGQQRGGGYPMAQSGLPQHSSHQS